MAFCDRQLYYFFVCLFLFWFCTPLNHGAVATFLVVCDKDEQRDDDVLPSGFLSANAASAESGDQPEVGK